MCLWIYRTKIIIGVLLIAFLATSSLAAEEKTPKAASHAEIIVSGSTTVQPLAEIWASEFNRLPQDYHQFTVAAQKTVYLILWEINPIWAWSQGNSIQKIENMRRT